MSGFLIDTSIFVAAERGALDLEVILCACSGGEVALSAITAAELLHGIHRAKTPAQRSHTEALVEAVLSRFSVLPVDLRVARLHGRLGADLAERGVSVGAHDLLIGATALAVGYKVASRDLRSFPRIPGLEMVKW